LNICTIAKCIIVFPFNILYKMLQQYVIKACAGRDSSHGFEHMHRVAQTSEKIARDLGMSSEIIDI